MSKTITIECCNCSDNINYDHCIQCDGKYYWCWTCGTYQHITGDDGKTKEGHNIICEKYYYCDYCDKKLLNINESNFIQFSNDFIFNKNNDITVIYEDTFYHYECLCKLLGDSYKKQVCNICKIYCNDINNMKNINNRTYDKDINVCRKCFDESNIPKCYYNGCNGQYVLHICCESRGQYNYAMACKKCSEKDWIKQ